MHGSFACPDCGCEIRLTGLSPGRHVRCDWCQGLVEVPFLPRVEGAVLRRSGRPAWRRRLPGWLVPVAAVLLVAIAVAVVLRATRSRWKTQEAETLTRLMDSAREAEGARQFGLALASVEAALHYGSRLNPAPENLAEIQSFRDRVARQDVETRLTALNGPGVACLPLQDRQRQPGWEPHPCGDQGESEDCS